jgi:hypothetical protein
MPVLMKEIGANGWCQIQLTYSMLDGRLHWNIHRSYALTVGHGANCIFVRLLRPRSDPKASLPHLTPINDQSPLTLCPNRSTELYPLVRFGLPEVLDADMKQSTLRLTKPSEDHYIQAADARLALTEREASGSRAKCPFTKQSTFALLSSPAMRGSRGRSAVYSL